MKGNIIIELTSPLLYPMEGMMDMGPDCTGPTPCMTCLTSKAPDIAISLEANLTLLWHSRVFQPRLLTDISLATESIPRENHFESFIR